MEKIDLKNIETIQTVIENQAFKSDFENVYKNLKNQRNNKCTAINGIEVNKKLNLPLGHEIGFLISLYEEIYLNTSLK